MKVKIFVDQGLTKVDLSEELEVIGKNYNLTKKSIVNICEIWKDSDEWKRRLNQCTLSVSTEKECVILGMTAEVDAKTASLSAKFLLGFIDRSIEKILAIKKTLIVM